jgi:hypothetical protein
VTPPFLAVACLAVLLATGLAGCAAPAGPQWSGPGYYGGPSTYGSPGYYGAPRYYGSPRYYAAPGYQDRRHRDWARPEGRPHHQQQGVRREHWSQERLRQHFDRQTGLR